VDGTTGRETTWLTQKDQQHEHREKKCKGEGGGVLEIRKLPGEEGKLRKVAPGERTFRPVPTHLQNLKGLFRPQQGGEQIRSGSDQKTTNRKRSPNPAGDGRARIRGAWKSEGTGNQRNDLKGGQGKRGKNFDPGAGPNHQE